jgi:hypothetical protein
MLHVQRFSQQCAHVALLLTALMHFAGVSLLTHRASGSWTEGSAIHAPGECPDGGPNHNERACRTFQTPAPDLVAGRGVMLAVPAVLVSTPRASTSLPVRSLQASSTQARAPPAA